MTKVNTLVRAEGINALWVERNALNEEINRLNVEAELARQAYNQRLDAIWNLRIPVVEKMATLDLAIDAILMNTTIREVS